MNIKELRIQSDGTASGTNVYDQNGNKIGLIRSLEWRVNGKSDLAEVTIKLTKIPVDIKAKNIKVEEES